MHPEPEKCAEGRRGGDCRFGIRRRDYARCRQIDVEHGLVDETFYDPRHPYTRGLLGSLPRPDVGGRADELQRIKGNPPSLLHLPPGCSFWPRCPYARRGVCNVTDPPLVQVRVGEPIELKGKSLDADTKRIMKAISKLLPPEANRPYDPTPEELVRT